MNTLLTYSENERRDFDISLVLLDREPAAYAPPDWLQIRQLDCGGSMIASIRALRVLFREAAPDIALSFLTRANIANVVASRKGGWSCVISERVNTSSHLGGGIRGSLARLLVRYIYPMASRIIAVSPGVAADLRDNFGVRADKLVTIENAVDVATVRARSEEAAELEVDAPYIAGMGRLVPNKNFALLIEAFHRSGVPGKLLILGEGPERLNLVELAARLGVADRVLLPGFAANPFPLLKHALAFVLPSNAEGFPNGLVEAMALGVPVISTNCPSGPSEILAELDEKSATGLMRAEHGLLVAPGSVSQMAEALVVLQSADVRRGYAEKAASRARDFQVETTKARYWDLFRAETAGS
jgi:N-acetylgalactosamine-N,N'-diacetylbacillosaminyl-diphospho-undecaprenol 4-alpha-N-acetylgalactosaminyltransferase